MCDLKLGDRVRRNGTDGEVVAVMTKPDKYGHNVLVMADSGSAYLCRQDGTSNSTTSNKWVKLPKIVKGRLYLNLTSEGLPVAYMTEEFARLMSSRTNRVIALPVEYEYEVKD